MRQIRRTAAPALDGTTSCLEAALGWPALPAHPPCVRPSPPRRPLSECSLGTRGAGPAGPPILKHMLQGGRGRGSQQGRRRNSLSNGASGAACSLQRLAALLQRLAALPHCMGSHRHPLAPTQPNPAPPHPYSRARSCSRHPASSCRLPSRMAARCASSRQLSTISFRGLRMARPR